MISPKRSLLDLWLLEAYITIWQDNFKYNFQEN